MGLSLDEKIKICYKAVIDKKGDNVIILDLKKRTSFTDSFLICSANSTRQVQSIADEIIKCLKLTGVKGISVEGYLAGKWVLLDCLDIVVHIFHKEARNFYDIERLWEDAPLINPIVISDETCAQLEVAETSKSLR